LDKNMAVIIQHIYIEGKVDSKLTDQENIDTGFSTSTEKNSIDDANEININEVVEICLEEVKEYIKQLKEK